MGAGFFYVSTGPKRGEAGKETASTGIKIRVWEGEKGRNKTAKWLRGWVAPVREGAKK